MKSRTFMRWILMLLLASAAGAVPLFKPAAHISKEEVRTAKKLHHYRVGDLMTRHELLALPLGSDTQTSFILLPGDDGKRLYLSVQKRRPDPKKTLSIVSELNLSVWSMKPLRLLGETVIGDSAVSEGVYERMGNMRDRFLWLSTAPVDLSVCADFGGLRSSDISLADVTNPYHPRLKELAICYRSIGTKRVPGGEIHDPKSCYGRNGLYYTHGYVLGKYLYGLSRSPLAMGYPLVGYILEEDKTKEWKRYERTCRKELRRFDISVVWYQEKDDRFYIFTNHCTVVYRWDGKRPRYAYSLPGLKFPGEKGLLRFVLSKKGYLYALTEHKLYVIDLRRPKKERIVVSMPLREGRDLLLSGDEKRLFYTERVGLFALDLRDPARPAFLHDLSVPSEARLSKSVLLKSDAKGRALYAFDPEKGELLLYDPLKKGVVEKVALLHEKPSKTLADAREADRRVVAFRAFRDRPVLAVVVEKERTSLRIGGRSGIVYELRTIYLP